MQNKKKVHRLAILKSCMHISQMADNVDQAEVGRVWFGLCDPVHIRVPHLLPGPCQPQQDLPL